jgi:hypothetical protein
MGLSIIRVVTIREMIPKTIIIQATIETETGPFLMRDHPSVAEDERFLRMRYTRSLMLQCFGEAQAYPEVSRAFSGLLERKGQVQIAGENRSSQVLFVQLLWFDGNVTPWCEA